MSISTPCQRIPRAFACQHERHCRCSISPSLQKPEGVESASRRGWIDSKDLSRVCVHGCRQIHRTVLDSHPCLIHRLNSSMLSSQPAKRKIDPVKPLSDGFVRDIFPCSPSAPGLSAGKTKIAGQTSRCLEWAIFPLAHESSFDSHTFRDSAWQDSSNPLLW